MWIVRLAHAVVVVAAMLQVVSAANTPDATVTIDVPAGYRSVHAAQAELRRVLQSAKHRNMATGVEVVLQPGVHHVGVEPLVLGSDDAGVDAEHPVVWRSADPSDPAGES